MKYKDPDEVLTPGEAIRAMLDGETLVRDGYRYKFSGNAFMNIDMIGTTNHFDGFKRLPEKKTRPMTRDEVLFWVSSANALGWVVRYCTAVWVPPQCHSYNSSLHEYTRAKITPTGVDESTICDFEVEE
jgi:hypothetical protein